MAIDFVVTPVTRHTITRKHTKHFGISCGKYQNQLKHVLANANDLAQIYIYIYILQIGILASTTRPLLATDTKLCKTVSVCIVGAARSTLFTACCLCRMRAPHKCILWLAVLSHACVFNIAGDCRPRVRACAKCAYTRQFACNFNIWNMENHDEYIFCELFFTSLFIMVAYFHLLCMFIMRQTHEKEKFSQN